MTETNNINNPLETLNIAENIVYVLGIREVKVNIIISEKKTKA